MSDDFPEHDQPDMLMRAIAGELAGLQSVATELEDCMAAVVQRTGYSDNDGTNRQILQDFDLLTQSLDGLRTFVNQLAEAAEGRPSIRVAEALSSVKLGDMRNRLARKGNGSITDVRASGTMPKIDLF